MKKAYSVIQSARGESVTHLSMGATNADRISAFQDTF